MPLPFGQDKNNARFRNRDSTQGERHRGQLQADIALVKSLFENRDHPFFKMLKRKFATGNVAWRQPGAPFREGTTTTELTLFNAGMNFIVEELIQMVEDTEDSK